MSFNLSPQSNECTEYKLSLQHQESLRVELAQQVQSAELLAEERNSYRAQVLEMNSALKNSLDHIKELRSKASPDSAAAVSASEDPFAEFTQRRPLQTANATSSSSGRNISSLQVRNSMIVQGSSLSEALILH